MSLWVIAEFLVLKIKFEDLKRNIKGVNGYQSKTDAKERRHE